MTNFSNHFLVSMPHMNDPFFEKSLIYICEHDDDGAMGIIINKTLPSQNVQEILTQTGLNKVKPYPEIFIGGPIATNMGLILHDSGYESDGELKISTKIKLTSNNQIIEDIINNNGPKDYLFLLGYSGWSQGQLEQEIENGDWLFMPANYKQIFQKPSSSKWNDTATQFGIDINSFNGGTAGKA